MLHEYAAIDPMALLFPSRLYVSLAERLHPSVPKSAEIKDALGRLTPEERLYILTRAKMLANYSKAVEEAAEIMICLRGRRPGDRGWKLRPSAFASWQRTAPRARVRLPPRAASSARPPS